MLYTGEALARRPRFCAREDRGRALGPRAEAVRAPTAGSSWGRGWPACYERPMTPAFRARLTAKVRRRSAMRRGATGACARRRRGEPSCGARGCHGANIDPARSLPARRGHALWCTSALSARPASRAGRSDRACTAVKAGRGARGVFARRANVAAQAACEARGTRRQVGMAPALVAPCARCTSRLASARPWAAGWPRSLATSALTRSRARSAHGASHSSRRQAAARPAFIRSEWWTSSSWPP